MFIKSLSAQKIKDSRSEPTIEISVNNAIASSPSGKSKGKYETPSYHKNLDWCIHSINSLKIPFEINSFNDLSKLESFIKNKFKLKDAKQFGANALFALESAILKALAKEQNKQLWQIINPNAKKLPVPVGNAVGGGLHSSKQKNHPEFQEFLLIPKGKTIKENISIMNQIYKKLKTIIKANSKNDEGAWQTSLSNEEILKILSKPQDLLTFTNLGGVQEPKKFTRMFLTFKDIRIGLDIAASSFYKSTHYQYKNKSLNAKAQIYYINQLINQYGIFYVEDPLQENDFNGFSKISKKALVTGDDLTATHLSRLKKAIKSNSINAMIIKPNQNGSLLELKEIFDICKKHKIKTILSHRSGETLDTALADYAFAFQADFIKTGISTKWREAKLNRLVQISKSL